MYKTLDEIYEEEYGKYAVLPLDKIVYLTSSLRENDEVFGRFEADDYNHICFNSYHNETLRFPLTKRFKVVKVKFEPKENE